jgi:stage II sporulation protein GA (sporulation sigma-E factor processing peptidase)
MGRVYLETVFAVNTLMNLLTLYIAGRLSGQRARLGRYLAASALGGLYAALMLLPFMQALGNVGVKIALSLIMAALSWRIRGWLPFLKGWASLVGVTAVGGGGAYAAAALLDSLQPWSGTVRVGENALLLTALGAVSLALFSSSALRRRGGAPARCSLRIWQAGRRYELEALLDTGNMLREPVSGLPVVLLDKGVGGKLAGCWPAAVEIPFGTAGGVSAVRAAPAERVDALCGGRWKRLGDVYLAVCDGRLAGGVEALLPPAALE